MLSPLSLAETIDWLKVSLMNLSRPYDACTSVNQAIIGSDNGLPAVRQQAII